jgi:error-prone DNA polymerase
MIPLTTRSHYSLMWGTASVKALCRHARRLGYDRLALTDTDNLCGLWPFMSACRREGIIPIIGAEVTDPQNGRRAVCLAKNAAGYRDLCRLLTHRHMDAGFDLATALPGLAGDMVILTASADLLKQWHRNGLHLAAAMARTLLPATHRLRRTAKALGIPLVATPGSFFLQPGAHGLHRLLRAIDLNTTLERLQPGQMAPSNAWLAGPDDYAERFAPCPEALANTAAIADQIDFTGPAFGLVMPPWHDSRNRSNPLELREAYDGARQRYGEDLPEPVVDRLEHELRIIGEMNFCAYFLVVQDIVRRSPRTCGRGSGAASLVAYCLGITNVCPVKHNLYFGRFLNPGRTDPPDIDVDFAWDERDGHRRRAGPVCRPCRHGVQPYPVPAPHGRAGNGQGFRADRCWRSAGSPGACPGSGGGAWTASLISDLQQRPETRHLDFIHPWPEILSTGPAIIGIPRHLSVHPGGVVITPIPSTLRSRGAAPKGCPSSSGKRTAAEDAGLVKIDLLGNRSLGVIRDAVANVRRPTASTLKKPMGARGRSRHPGYRGPGPHHGLLLHREPGHAPAAAKSRCGRFRAPGDPLLHHPAGGQRLYPGVHPAPARRPGIPSTPCWPTCSTRPSASWSTRRMSPGRPRPWPVSDAEADGLRKIMSKKDRQRRLADFRHRFIAGARGGFPGQADAVWAMMMSFSGYSFCKPHSASYARVSFQAAYLKTHHPAAFMAGVISNQGGFYSTFAYVSEARRMGHSLDRPR